MHTFKPLWSKWHPLVLSYSNKTDIFFTSGIQNYHLHIFCLANITSSAIKFLTQIILRFHFTFYLIVGVCPRNLGLSSIVVFYAHFVLVDDIGWGCDFSKQYFVFFLLLSCLWLGDLQVYLLFIFCVLSFKFVKWCLICGTKFQMLITRVNFCRLPFLLDEFGVM